MVNYWDGENLTSGGVPPGSALFRLPILHLGKKYYKILGCCQPKYLK